MTSACYPAPAFGDIMRTHSLTALLAAWLLAGLAPAVAQAPATEDEIVVTGQRAEEAIRAFVGAASAAVAGENQLARWDRRICPGVVGLQPRFAQFVIDRMAQRAVAVGLDVGEPGCRANILIAVARDPDAVAQDLFDRHRDKMGWYYERGRRTQGRDALRAFVASDAPVRWWHVSRTVTRDSERIGDTPGGGAPVTRVTGNPSRLKRPTRQDLGAAFVIVDARQLGKTGFEALADYLAMVSLAQIDPATETKDFPTILNMFAADGPKAMTDWDVAYLQGLYAVTRDAASAARQKGEIARSMNRELAAPTAP